MIIGISPKIAIYPTGPFGLIINPISSKIGMIISFIYFNLVRFFLKVSTVPFTIDKIRAGIE
ncbi:hypothetical protein [Winogradskyella sp. PG-2]|uniref:hypothetical protein n=1 Tax=Winogradskyella sp. PG-2 TaxID=754409 RepID=UPI000458997E|nr:hypothetical protein [Winogradskyella sp. PG-2]BAO76566.1 hypothetical protein WPG_2336 [Winogradskyella sp. PG-2]